MSDLTDGPWQLRGLTAQDVSNLDAATQVAFDAGDHGMTDVAGTLAKVKQLVDAVRSTGQWPERVFCEGERDEQSADGPKPEGCTWTDHVGGPCRSCRRKFRVTQEAIDYSRANGGYHGATDAAVAADLDFCLDCVEGVTYPEEHDMPETRALALSTISPAKAAPFIACLIAAEWQTQQNIMVLSDRAIPDFAAVHEHVDGNMLGFDAVTRLLGPEATTDRVIDYLAAAHPIVDEYLRLRHTANAGD